MCGTGNFDRVKQDLGTDEAIDHCATDLLTQGRRFDVLFDVAGALDWRSASVHLLMRAGLYLATGGTRSAAIATGAGRGAVP
jgi:NADPH:quinone reductase-like Zn-dependent oxidoreductase